MFWLQGEHYRYRVLAFKQNQTAECWSCLSAKHGPIERTAALPERLGLVAGRRPINGADAHRRGRMEERLVGQNLQDPGLVDRIVSGDPPFGPLPQNARDVWQEGSMHKPALRMPRLGPRVRKKQKHAIQGIGRQQPDQRTRIGRPYPKVARQQACRLGALGHKAREQRADAVFEHLAGNQTRPWVGLYLSQRMLAAAEADF